MKSFAILCEERLSYECCHFRVTSVALTGKRLKTNTTMEIRRVWDFKKVYFIFVHGHSRYGSFVRSEIYHVQELNSGRTTWEIHVSSNVTGSLSHYLSWMTEQLIGRVLSLLPRSFLSVGSNQSYILQSGVRKTCYFLGVALLGFW